MIIFISLLLLIPHQISSEDTVVMVIGGRDDHYMVDGDDVIHQVKLISQVEIFGCPDPTPISYFPTAISGHAAAALIDRTAMVCGGATATNNSRYTSFTNKCRKFDLSSNTWEEVATMQGGRSGGHLMDVDVGEGKLPTIMGGRNVTEDGWMGDYDFSVDQLLDGAWTPTSNMLPDMHTHCMTMVEDQIYQISSRWGANATVKIDPLTWVNETVAGSPYWTPIYCMPYVMDGSPGIFSSRGNWYNISNGEWSRNDHNYSQITGAGVASFNGSPVKIGGWLCEFDGHLIGSCNVTADVLQYNDASGEWDLIGELEQARTYPVVVTLPASVCNVPAPPPTTTPTAPPTTSAPVEDTVIMVIGGRDDHYKNLNGSVIHNVSLISHVEVFGCPESTPISYFPTSISGHAAAAVVDGTAMVCGGATDTLKSGYTSFTDKCHKLDPDTNTWEEVEPMNGLRSAHYMVALDMGNGKVPTIMGGQNVTEDGYRGEYDYSVDQLLNGKWSPTSKMLPDMRINCMTVLDDQLYTISSKYSANETVKVDPLTWLNETVAVAPYWTPIYCMPYTMDGSPGIFSSRGNWLNIRSGEWSRNTHNYSQITGAGVASLRGNPVKVGGWVCKFSSTGLDGCDVTGEVLQYNDDSGEWDLIGDLQQNRTFPVVLTMPASICDVPPPPPTSPAPSTSSPVTNTATPASTTPAPEEDTVIMILGGRDDHYKVTDGVVNHNVSLISHVEIFGCPESTTISPYPTPISGHAAGSSIAESAMVCGGATATHSTAYRNFTNACNRYDSEANLWEQTDDLKSFRSQPYLFELDMGNGKVPTLMGGYNISQEIGIRGAYDYSIEQLLDGVWTPSSKLLPDMAIRCMAVVNDKLYSISSKYYENVTMEIDPQTWINETIASSPYWTPTYCLPYTMDGYQGIFSSRGNWLNLSSGEWSRNSHSYHSMTGAGVGSLRGNPVKVGGWVCKFNGTVLDKCDVSRDVVQYNQTSGDWDKIGELEQARTFPVVVTLPASVCRASPDTSTAPPPTSSTSEIPTTTASAAIFKINSAILVLLVLFYIF